MEKTQCKRSILLTVKFQIFGLAVFQFSLRFLKLSHVCTMSYEERNIKRQCVNNDDLESLSSTTNAPVKSQPCGGAPMKNFSDLVFSVSGTMPASDIENSTLKQITGRFSGKRKLDSDACASAIVNESEVGITEYISKHEGFSGILKQR